MDRKLECQKNYYEKQINNIEQKKRANLKKLTKAEKEFIQKRIDIFSNKVQNLTPNKDVSIKEILEITELLKNIYSMGVIR
jgi:t-SNARE complex subunit (syntaxin)